MKIIFWRNGICRSKTEYLEREQVVDETKKVMRIRGYTVGEIKFLKYLVL